MQSIKNYKFVGKESDLTAHIFENIHDIADNCKWGKIQRVEREFRIQRGGINIRADIMVWHEDGTATVIEAKTLLNNRNDGINAISQCLFYGSGVEHSLGNIPRLVIALPTIDPILVEVVRRFNLPIRFLIIDPEKAIYI